jgi:hypothetical protein
MLPFIWESYEVVVQVYQDCHLFDENHMIHKKRRYSPTDENADTLSNLWGVFFAVVAYSYFLKKRQINGGSELAVGRDLRRRATVLQAAPTYLRS